MKNHLENCAFFSTELSADIERLTTQLQEPTPGSRTSIVCLYSTLYHAQENVYPDTLLQKFQVNHNNICYIDFI